ncbi:MAG: CoA transferase [Leisingera sp.]
MTAQTQAKGILHGIRVLDLSRMLSGPYCTMMLADHGAEVIKIEGAAGDTSRSNGPWRDDDPGREMAGYFVSLNRNKKSVQLNLKTPEGQEALKRLVAGADVLVENFRPGVMERLGLGYEILAQVRPGLVYAAIRGFGDPRSGESPYASWPSYDIVAQAMGGILSQTGPDPDTPCKVGPGIGDVFAGMMMSFGIMAALRQSEATGESQFLDVGMYDAILSLCERAVYLHDIAGSVAGPEGNDHPLLAPFGLFPARDGQVAIGIVDDSFWQALASAMNRQDLAADPRFATRSQRAQHTAVLRQEVSAWTSARSKAELTAALGGVVPFGPLNTVADIFADPHAAARGLLAKVPHPNPGARPFTVAANPLRFGSAPLPEPQAAPRLGADTEHYLSEAAPLQISDDRKRALRNAFGAFPTGVTVVTTRQCDGTPRGFTANSFTSVSLDPPMLLICLAKTAHSCQVFTEAPRFAVNILAEDQKEISNLFASRSPSKFAESSWRTGSSDVPLLDNTLAWFECTRHRLVDAGDHLILIGTVSAFDAADGNPLGYHRGGYFSLGVGDNLVEAAAKHSPVRLSALLRIGGEVLLREELDGSFTVPKAPPGASTQDALLRHLTALGLTPGSQALYAVYDDTDAGFLGVVFRGNATGKAPSGHRLFPIQGIPLDCVPDPAERSMLERYAEETRIEGFGIYQGNTASGTVHQLSPS